MTYIEPLLLLCIVIILAGVLNRDGRRRRHAALGGVLALFLLSWPPVDWLLGLPLEARYPVRPFDAPPGINAVVVLGSAVRPAQYERPYPLPDFATFNRCEHAAWIYQRWGPFPVLACEGRQRSAEAGEAMGELLRRAGVPDNMIWAETESRSTHENAVFGARVLRAHSVKRIVLVVDAQSMPRAAACFRKEGFDVIPAPIEIRTLGPWREEFLPNWRSIHRNEITLHELVGLAVYRLRGWI